MLKIGRVSKRWWWAFGLLIAIPALILTGLGLRSVDLERIEHRQAFEERQRQIALLAETALSATLARVERAGPESFSLDRAGTLIFSSDRMYIADPGFEPHSNSKSLPTQTRAAIEMALTAEAQSDIGSAIHEYRQIGKDPKLAGWATLAIARLRTADDPNALGEWVKSHPDSDSLSPDGTPVALLASGLVRPDLSGSQHFLPYLLSAMDRLRAGTWWLSYSERKILDEDLRATIRELGQSLGPDARLESAAAIQRALPSLRRETPAHTVANADGKPVLILVRPAHGGWTGTELQGQNLLDLAQSTFASIRHEVSFPLSIVDPSGTVIWGEKLAAKSTRGFALASIPGWELRIGEIADPAADRQRRLWYGLLTVLLIMILFGMAMTARVVSREVALSRLQAEFAASITHEFKSPLTSIRLLVERLRGGRLLTPATIRGYHETIDREAERLERLVNRVLEAHRIQSGQRQYRFAPHSIGDIARTVVENLRTLGDAKRIGLDLNIDDPDREIEMDRTAIQDSLENLLENALKYSPADTCVKVTVRHEQDKLHVAIRDQGMGIDPADLPRIFDRFYRGSRGQAQSVKGTGLGLALVKAVVEGHGGAVEVDSTPGEGSEFRFHIPIRQEAYVPSVDRG